MSFHFSKQYLIEPALNFSIFSSRKCFNRSKSNTSNTSNISSKYNVWFGNSCIFGLDDSEKSCLFFLAWIDNLKSFALILESSPWTSKRTWSLITLLSIFSYLKLFGLPTRTLTCLIFLDFLQIQTLSHKATILMFL